MEKLVLESKYHSTTIGELISLLEKYPKDLPFYYYPETRIEAFQIVEVFDDLGRYFKPNDLRLMFLAISTKKNELSNDETDSKDINLEVICH